MRFRLLLANAGEHRALALAEAPPEFLSPREETILAGLTVLARRRKWLMGRWAGKRLLRELAMEARGDLPESLQPWCAAAAEGTLLPSRISILNDSAGVPHAELEGEGPLVLSLSISHRGEWGLAALSLEPGVAIGADLETTEARDQALVRQFFTDEEEAAVKRARGDEDRVVARIWSAKEAVLKALGAGLRHDTRGIQIGGYIDSHLEVPEGWRPLQVRLSSALSALVAARSLALLARDQGDQVITVALLSSVSTEAC